MLEKKIYIAAENMLYTNVTLMNWHAYNSTD